MSPRSMFGALVALSLFAPTATAQEVVPLAGKGANIQPIARVNIAGVNEVEMAGDWAFVSTDKVGTKDGGLVIVNVADPTKPFVQGTWNASVAEGILSGASFGDVDLSPDGNLAALTNAHGSPRLKDKFAWVVLIDISDKANPKLVGKIIDDATMDYVHTSTLDNKMLYTNPQAAAFYPQPGNGQITAFDISDPTKPVKKGVIRTPGSDVGLAHDSYVDHRPDGKTLMYAASVHKSDVIDITDPLKSNWLQSMVSPFISISHDVQPNHNRKIIVVDDEGAAGGQLDESVSACGKAGTGPASADSGSVHFYEAAPDGTFAKGGAVHLGSFNAPTNVNTGACVAHVFWQAPDENRLTQAYYRTGAFVLDFENPADPNMLGWFLADGGAEYWSNKPHRGYLYATDMEHGLDILKYTGEGGKRWPATAGPAEKQRAARQGVSYAPIAGVKADQSQSQSKPGSGSQSGAGGQATAGSEPEAQQEPGGSQSGSQTGAQSRPSGPAGASRTLGAFAFKTAVRHLSGRANQRATLVLTFTDAKGRIAGRLRVGRTAAGKPTLAISGVAVAGRYRWTLTAGRKVLRRGSVIAKPAAQLAISPAATLVATVRWQRTR